MIDLEEENKKINRKIECFSFTSVRVSSWFEPVKSKSAIPSLSIFNKSMELYEGFVRYDENWLKNPVFFSISPTICCFGDGVSGNDTYSSEFLTICSSFS